MSFPHVSVLHLSFPRQERWSAAIPDSLISKLAGILPLIYEGKSERRKRKRRKSSTNSRGAEDKMKVGAGEDGSGEKDGGEAEKDKKLPQVYGLDSTLEIRVEPFRRQQKAEILPSVKSEDKKDPKMDLVDDDDDE